MFRHVLWGSHVRVRTEGFPGVHSVGNNTGPLSIKGPPWSREDLGSGWNVRGEEPRGRRILEGGTGGNLRVVTAEDRNRDGGPNSDLYLSSRSPPNSGEVTPPTPTTGPDSSHLGIKVRTGELSETNRGPVRWTSGLSVTHTPTPVPDLWFPSLPTFPVVHVRGKGTRSIPEPRSKRLPGSWGS